MAINARFADEETELGDSLSRSGKGSMLASLRGVDGSAAAPAVSFTSEPGTGLYKSAAGEFAISLLGALAAKFTAGILSIAGTARAFLQSTAANSVVQILGNRNATDTGADVETNGQATRTAGLLLQINNNAIPKLNVDYQGLLTLGSQAGSLQPASIVTAITPDTNIAGIGPGFWKDATGTVHLRGGLTNNTGALATNLVTTNPLPVGFRPASGRLYAASIGSGTPTSILVGADGKITGGNSIPNGGSVYLDGISFLAEQ